MYQVLARKYRPRNFTQLVGQNHVSRALTSALARGRLHHAYLFTGTRGVGKTTIARILAKCLNCETGVTATPCENCATCKAVNEGRFIDLIEIDAASRTKVEDTRELLDNVPYAPTQGRYKVYLIDEVHMLSTHSFNALLKTLEEPPEHVKFLFATTDPQKLPITVISRCLQFTLRPLTVEEISQHLTEILATEQIATESDAVWQIADAAQGSLRDALSLTDQAIAYGQGEIHHQDVKDMLGLIDRTIIYDLIAAIHQNRRQQVSQLLLQFRQQALDVNMVLDQLISTLHELALLHHLPELSLNYSAEINQKIQQLAQQIAPEDIQLYYQIACKGRADLQLAVSQVQGFEMAVLRLLAFRPLAVDEIAVATQPPAQQTTAPHLDHTASHAASQHSESRQDVRQHNTRQHNTSQHSESRQEVQQTESLPRSETDHHVIADAPSMQNSAPVVDVRSTSPSNRTTDNVQNHVQDNAQRHISEQRQAPLAAQSLEATVDATDVAHSETAAVAGQNIAQSEMRATQQLSPHLTAEELEVKQSTSAELDIRSNVAHLNPPSHILQDFGLAAFQASQRSQALDVQHCSEQELLFLKPKQWHDASSETVVLRAETPEQLFEQTTIAADDNNTDHLMLRQPAAQTTQLTPQQILQLPVHDLTGVWTVEKWEYWFRQSSLSPAIQELAQHGVMTGEINAQSVFQIPPQYEQLLQQTQHELQQALLENWPETIFSVRFTPLQDVTPYRLQQQRKHMAFQRAEQMLQQETVVKQFIQLFDAQLLNIQLK
ncbi:DNA polymerase III subunit gamma/tau [Acinetobacter larvae]|uniref:DNA polymerase III subunit gamma/tau n=1 Tax=Acinetobacter larvae TaxID=1789224 RepID=A0A1B2LYI0_9GAMM|nr:DNA polymerase III subunit gamma/tau [Acinetobacter larvae]AOA58004.1 hypothetical protein BFG52_06330 [Acinetobacter larvae]